MTTTYQITSSAGINMGTYGGATPLEAYAAMLRDAGYSARVEGGAVVTDAPDGDEHATMTIRRVATDEDIADLADRAARAGDHDLVATCERALGAGYGVDATDRERREAREACAEALAER